MRNKPQIKRHDQFSLSLPGRNVAREEIVRGFRARRLESGTEQILIEKIYRRWSAKVRPSQRYLSIGSRHLALTERTSKLSGAYFNQRSNQSSVAARICGV